MEQIGNKWKADKGNFFVRRSDNKVMGDTMFLGNNDSIDNYFEKAFTNEEREEFNKKYSYGGYGNAEDSEAPGMGPDVE